MTSATMDEEVGSGGAGGASLAGYEYQIDVSVWLALDLVLVTRLTSALQLEPASQEDLEAELAEDEPARAVSRVPLPDYTLIVQVKRRGGDAWTPTSLKTLLQHGSVARPSAASRLKDPKARYLLITSAGLSRDAAVLKVRRAGNWPKPPVMPKVFSDILSTDAAGRVAVIANEDDERLRTDIDRLLTEGCRVPNSRLENCRLMLREEARSRIAGAGGGMWGREELERVIRDHGGYLASSPELEHYIHPTNWDKVRAAMRERSAIMIIGQSGTGKTLATMQLHHELRNEIPGLTRVPIRHGPYQLRDDQTQPPVLYDIEDPWGRFDFDPRSRPWNDQLAGFFTEAKPGRMIVATSRLDVAKASKALDDVAHWIVELEAEHYGKEERERIYQSRIEGLPRDLQPIARMARKEVLDQLDTPLEIQKFFDALRTLDRAGLQNPPRFISDAIDKAHQNSIERTVIEQIEERNDAQAAAVIWGMLKASDKLSRSVLRQIEDGLADLETDMERGVSPLVDFFVAARNLRQGNGQIVTYYHPRVEAGIEKAIAGHRQKVRHTLALLLDLLVSAEGPGAEWGAGAAARILAAGRSHFSVKASAATTAKIDAWLEARLSEGGASFDEHLELASEAGSSANNEAELARFLLNRGSREPLWAFTGWEALERTESWYAARRAHPATKSLIETFIRRRLPTDRVRYPAIFATHLQRLASDLSVVFLEVADRTVHLGVIESDDAIAEGALQDLIGFERIVDAAVADLTLTDESRRRAAELRLDLVNEVHNDDYAQYLAENDDGYTASVYITAYVKRKRAVSGWRSLISHRHAHALLGDWLRLLAQEVEETALDPEELHGAFTAALGSDFEKELWTLLLSAWDTAFIPASSDRVMLGHTDDEVAEVALACLIERAPDAFRIVVENLVARGRAKRLVEIGAQLASLRRRRGHDGRKHHDAATTAMELLTEPFRTISKQAFNIETEKPIALGEEARSALSGIADPSEVVRRLRVAIDAVSPLSVEDDLRWLLANTEESSAAVDALEAAIRLGMTAEIEAALDHKFAHVEALAVTTIGSQAGTPLPDRLLAKASDPRSPVRKALVALLKQRPHASHLEATVKLVRDTWSRDSRHYGERDSFPIAQEAVEALEALAAQMPLPIDTADDLFELGRRAGDPDVRLPIFRTLAASGNLGLQTRLFELAVKPGKADVRRSAADALLHAADAVSTEVTGKITAWVLETRYEPVAASFSLLLAGRGDPERVRAISVKLATNPKRRVLILLLVWVMHGRDPQLAQDIAAMLPADHIAVTWAMGGQIEEPDDALLADLGDPGTCRQVLFYMRLKT